MDLKQKHKLYIKTVIPEPDVKLVLSSEGHGYLETKYGKAMKLEIISKFLYDLPKLGVLMHMFNVLLLFFNRRV